MSVKFIKGNRAQLEELVANLFSRVCVNVTEEGEAIAVGFELNGTDEEGHVIKIDTELLNDVQLMVLEAGLSARIQAGVLDRNEYSINEDMLANTFCLTAGSPEKLDIVTKDILQGARVGEENIVVLQQPFAPGMYTTLTNVVIAFNLNEDQMKAIQLNTKAAAHGIKITDFTKKVRMVGGATANVVNRVSREVTLATVEIGATVGVGMIKTGVEATACVANTAIRELQPKELLRGDNVQSLMKTVKGLWGKKENSNQVIGRGFAQL